jgi:hypothetical protein
MEGRELVRSVIFGVKALFLGNTTGKLVLDFLFHNLTKN